MSQVHLNLIITPDIVRLPDGTPLLDMGEEEISKLPEFIMEESEEGLIAQTPFFEGWVREPGGDEPVYWWRLHYLPRPELRTEDPYDQDPTPWVLIGSRP